MDATERMKKSIENLNKTNTEAMIRLDEGIKRVLENRRKQTGEQSRPQ